MYEFNVYFPFSQEAITSPFFQYWPPLPLHSDPSSMIVYFCLSWIKPFHLSLSLHKHDKNKKQQFDKMKEKISSPAAMHQCEEHDSGS